MTEMASMTDMAEMTEMTEMTEMAEMTKNNVPKPRNDKNYASQAQK